MITTKLELLLHLLKCILLNLNPAATWCKPSSIFFFFFKVWNASRICVSSLRRGHANLLCIVPILVYVLPKWAPSIFKNIWNTFTFECLLLIFLSHFYPKEYKHILMYNWNLELKIPLVANLRWKSFSELNFHYSYNKNSIYTKILRSNY